jgi:hypothetical protein
LGSRLAGPRARGAMLWHAEFGNVAAAHLITYLYGLWFSGFRSHQRQQHSHPGSRRAALANERGRIAFGAVTYARRRRHRIPIGIDDSSKLYWEVQTNCTDAPYSLNTATGAAKLIGTAAACFPSMTGNPFAEVDPKGWTKFGVLSSAKNTYAMRDRAVVTFCNV